MSAIDGARRALRGREWAGRAPGRGLSFETAAGIVIVLLCAALVLYPVVFLVQAALNVGDPGATPPTAYGIQNFGRLFENPTVLVNTVVLSAVATALSVVIGFALAWTLSRTNVPGARVFEQIAVLPYYVTPLVGALAWDLLAAPGGFANQVWQRLGGAGHPIDVTTPVGIAVVMALFDGSVAYVMISAVMKSMDPSLEEASRLLGAGKLRTIRRITLPLVTPGMLGAVVFVFAEMLGSFGAPLVLGAPKRFYVVTTAIFQLTSQYPPDYPTAAAMGVGLFAVMFILLWVYRRIIARGRYATITGRGFRPRALQLGGLRWVLFAGCVLYALLAAVLPLASLVLASVERLATAFPSLATLTTHNYVAAFESTPLTQALQDSLVLAVGTACAGIVLTGLVAWVVYRSSIPFRGAIEYLVMFPQSVPRLVFAFGLLWAWLVFPLHIYGTMWLLLIAYLTVFLPLGVRTVSGVILQIDPVLEECARVCGAGWLHQVRTVTAPLLRPGLVAGWLLLFIASVRELGASILLVSGSVKLISPTIVDTWFGSNSEWTAAAAVVQTVVVFVGLMALVLGTRRIFQVSDVN